MTIKIEKSSGLLSLTTKMSSCLRNLSDIDKQMLRDAIVEEYKAINIYEQLSNQAENLELKKIFLHVAQEEKVHIGEFEKMLDATDAEHKSSVTAGKEEAVETLTKDVI